MTSQTGLVTRPADRAAGRESEERARVAIWAADPITLTGLTQTLTARLDVFVAGDEHPGDVDVLVFAPERVDAAATAALRRAVARWSAPVVLVTGDLDRSHLMSLVESRVVAVLHRSAATEQRLMRAIDLAARGGGAMPPNLLGDLLRQIKDLQQDVLAPLGMNSASMTPREIDVVRLLADGLDTEEIGNRLCYSQRTVKNIIQAMTSRLNVRNRPHLVAYGLRTGVI
ncbi:DNA-binding response regulator, NarL/FixJ family, contains REC and HTH domains [Saccharopolyspora antimicrobica]|uniref:DNA-binding NarL/FixJ family response regulator n=1 Tax=Saccharopolyspora antimicrobica TaxID=455193 RepID=A0A1I5B6M4_9PSEU|nr:response regulator transcription factor [Saccharopolyspora antimicrobica]RKT86484.1 DNA-binding NarL/FixJ family response regulator [Saccharopolyspora antimicrobica]SFN70353.1 DNA-binding response regulator, NarL/FixJ family, contains REC and HTH domains [Saccharopolyspora antimicrobica]